MRHDRAGSMAMAVTGSPLLARVRRLLGVREPARLSSSGWVVAILTALMVSGAGVTSWVRGFPLASFAGDEIAASGSVVRAAAGAGARNRRLRSMPRSRPRPSLSSVLPATASRHRRRQLMPDDATIAAVDRARIEAARAADQLSAGTTRSG